MLLSTCKHHSNLTSSDQIVTALNVSCWEHITTSLLYQSPDTALNDDADEFIQLPSLLWLVPGDIDVAALTQRHHSSRTSVLLIILSARCMCLALLWICGCHVCLLTGFQPYGMARIWTKLNATGCQEQGRVRQQGEHVKRPDGFLCGDGDLVGQSVLVGEVSKCETRLFSIMAAVAA